MANTPGTVRYPTNLDDLDSLVRPANNLTPTTITDNPLTSGATTINVVSTTGYPATGILTIESEYVTYTGTTSTTFTGCARGAEGSSAAAHASGVAVNCFITAARHTVLANATIQTETKLGTGSSTPAANQVLAGTGAGVSAWSGLTWTSLTLQNSWVAANSSTPAVALDPLGRVWFRGVVTSGTFSATLCAALGATFRPTRTCDVGYSAGNGTGGYSAGAITIDSSGIVTIFGNAGYNNPVCLDGLSFIT